MSSAENKQIAQKFIDEIWNKGNLEGLSRFVTPHIIYHARGEDVTGIENSKILSSGSMGVNNKKLSLLIIVITIESLLRNSFCSFFSTSTPANI